MTFFGRTTLLALASCAALLSSAVSAGATIILYAQSSGAGQTDSAAFTPMPGLQITLPAVAGKSHYALVMLDVPNPFATGNNFPGGTFGISVNGTVQPIIGVFTSDSQIPQSAGRKPVTVILRVPLTSSTQTVTGVWQNVRGSSVRFDTPNSLSAILE